MNSLCFCCCDSLRLTLPDQLSFCLRHVTQQLQNNVRDQRTNQVPSFAGVQQWHIQHHNIRVYFFCYETPLFKDLIIISPEAVYTLHDNGERP